MKSLKKSLDILWSQCIKLRDKKCVICGRTHGIESAHIFGRVKMSVRWLLYNGLTLCTDCHKWAHSNPARFQFFAQQHIGIEIYNALKKRAKTIMKVDRDLLEKAKAELLTFQNSIDKVK